MKKLVLMLLILLMVGGLAYAQEGQITIRGALGLMFISPINDPYDRINFYDFRGGGHIDIMYNLGRFEIGGEVGIYVMEVEEWIGWDYYYLLRCEIPVNVIVRMNFDQERLFGIEVRGGAWFRLEMDEYYDYNDVTFNVGARAALGVFYIGADYISESFWNPTCISIEAGIKIAFE